MIGDFFRFFQSRIPAPSLQHNPLHGFETQHQAVFNVWRLVLLSVLLAFMLSIIAVRLCIVCLFPQQENQVFPHQTICLPRKDIFDRNGIVLATSIPTFSLFAHPHLITTKKEAAQSLNALFPEYSVDYFFQHLQSKKKFVWLVRHIPPHFRLKIQALGIEGLEMIKEQKRIYPHQNLCAHLLGLTNIDQKGIAGLEKFFDERLETESIRLSLDMRLQNQIHTLLQETITSFSAKGGNVILADIQTGEILSMVSLPDFSAQEMDSVKEEQLFNRNVNGVYEFGSVLKIFNAAMCLEAKVCTLSTVFDASAPLKMGRFKIKDFRGKNRPMTVEEGFIYSSNIVNGKMALEAGIDVQKAFFKKIGFFNPSSIELYEQAKPIIPKSWSRFETVTTSYGYGLSITPLQLVQALQMVVTGYRRPLTLLHKTNPPKAEARLISYQTSQNILKLMRKAVLEGQAKKASAKTCSIGAKTGTANQQSQKGGYLEKNNLTSCLAVFPIHAPRYALLVCIDRPKPNAQTHFFVTGGWVAAPLIAKIIDSISSILGVITPKAPEKENISSSHADPTHSREINSPSDIVLKEKKAENPKRSSRSDSQPSLEKDSSFQSDFEPDSELENDVQELFQRAQSL
jgi:cell division protein FtsI (penicillin-binding protein 3)